MKNNLSVFQDQKHCWRLQLQQGTKAEKAEVLCSEGWEELSQNTKKSSDLKAKIEDQGPGRGPYFTLTGGSSWDPAIQGLSGFLAHDQEAQGGTR